MPNELIIPDKLSNLDIPYKEVHSSRLPEEKTSQQTNGMQFHQQIIPGHHRRYEAESTP